MPAAVPWSLSLLLLVATGWLVAETREVAQVAGEQEIAARAARALAAANEQARARLARELDDERALRAAAERRAADVEQRLQQALLQVAGSAELLAARDRTETALRAARAEHARAIAQPMPEGVRLCLQAIEECLRADGFDGVRFLRARALDADALRGAELLDVDLERHASALYVADRLDLRLDRAKGTLTFRFRQGSRLRDGVREEFEPDGTPLVFAPVTGRLWESRLPYLLVATGDYPADVVAAPARPAGELTPSERRAWLDRLEQLLAGAATEPKLRVTGIQGLHEGRFQNGRVQGFDGKRLMVLSADCQRLAVEVDDQANVVCLLLQEGVLHQAGGVSTISADGHRMLLPTITPRQARDTMLGMVISR